MSVRICARRGYRNICILYSCAEILNCPVWKPLHTLRFCPSKNTKRQFSVNNDRRVPDSTHPSFLHDYKHTLTFPAPTLQIEQLSELHLGKKVVLHGYLGSRSVLSKSLYFVQLLDKGFKYSVQIISTAGKGAKARPSHDKIKTLGEWSPVIIEGVVKRREPPKSSHGDINKIRTVEIELENIQCMNEFPPEIIISEESWFPPEQRHLQIRKDETIRDALTFRAGVARLCRRILDRLGFTEVETPLLFRSTPEGAREFLVPTRTKGRAYALPQSPQQYKQILMASGISKYYQIAKCFRDEDLRADRQPEFTQLDLEMSFATGDTVMVVIEALIKELWAELKNIRLAAEPFPRMTYHDAMSKYGSDKPDNRLAMEISKIGHLIPVDLVSKLGPLTDPIVEVMKLSLSHNPKRARDFVSTFMDSSEAKPFLENPEGQPGIFVFDVTKPLQGLQAFGFEAAEYIEDALHLENGDLVVLQARKEAPFSGSSTTMGNLRLALHKAAVAQRLIPAPTGFEFLWITDFPLFSPSNHIDPGQGGTAGLSSTHHPFTAPKSPSDVDLLLATPLEAKGEHYDLVVNGIELGGGSKRIHNARVQEFVLRDVLKVSDERLKDFTHLLDALRAGCPPHAGIALGFDRLCAVMLRKESIRDVIAFPKTGKGEDLLVKSPGVLTQDALNTYHLQLKD